MDIVSSIKYKNPEDVNLKIGRDIMELIIKCEECNSLLNGDVGGRGGTLRYSIVLLVRKE